MAAMVPSIDLTLVTGPLLIAHLLNWGLFGVLTVQIYTYYCAFPSDTWRRKSIVAITLVLELVQVIMSTSDAFRIFAKGWADTLQLDNIGLYWFDIIIISAIISLICQLFYASRILMLTGSHIASGFVCLLALTQSALAVWDGIMTHDVRTLLNADTTPLIHRSGAAWASVSLTCNITITCTVSICLWKMKQRTKIRQTTDILARSITLTVETGLAGTLCTAITLFLFLLQPNVFLFAVPLFVTSKVYSNSLLAVLNTRVRIIGGRNAAGLSIMDEDIVTNLSLSFARGDRSTTDATRTLQSGIFVGMTRTTEDTQVSDTELNWKPEYGSRLMV